MQDSQNRVQWIYSSTSNQELQERYDQWAAEYDKDLAEEFAWNARRPRSTCSPSTSPPGQRSSTRGRHRAGG